MEMLGTYTDGGTSGHETTAETALPGGSAKSVSEKVPGWLSR